MQTSPNCDSWQFSRKHIEDQSPSRKDGLSLRRENSHRRLALAFTQDVGCLLKMDQYTIATAFVYWQRFFIIQSLSKNDPYLIASACLLLAGKVEENFKSLQKITEMSFYVRNKKDPKALESIKSTPKLLLAEMDRVVKAEEALLVTMNFDFFVSHPYKPICSVVKEFGFTNRQSERDRTFFQIAWNFANDSLRTTLCLQPFRPMDIAAACVNLSATALSVQLPKAAEGAPWWTKYGVSPETLQDVELQIMSLYKRKEGDSQTPTSCLSLPATPSINAPPAKKQRTETPRGSGMELSEELICRLEDVEVHRPKRTAANAFVA
ncbi:unnamed protein product [Closterium sp. Naga37s-1]|nr:unnamed protein product [Closterium sp. Naga37s-1]